MKRFEFEKQQGDYFTKTIENHIEVASFQAHQQKEIELQIDYSDMFSNGRRYKIVINTKKTLGAYKIECYFARINKLTDEIEHSGICHANVLITNILADTKEYYKQKNEWLYYDKKDVKETISYRYIPTQWGYTQKIKKVK